VISDRDVFGACPYSEGDIVLDKTYLVSVARRLECDEDKGRFEAKLGKLAAAKVKTAKTK
jgi:hypothetical protein